MKKNQRNKRKARKQKKDVNTKKLANDCCKTAKSDYVFGNCSCGHIFSSVISV